MNHDDDLPSTNDPVQGKRLEKARPEIKLADALDKFFYDLAFTAPECWSERVNQLGSRIQPTMEALGYPKAGQKKDAETA